MFDGPKYLETLDPPAFTDLDGIVHTGRLLSTLEMMEFQPAIEKFAGDGFKLPAEWPEFKAFVTGMCELSGLPAEKLFVMPQSALMAAVVHLLGCLRGRAREKPGASPTPGDVRGA